MSLPMNNITTLTALTDADLGHTAHCRGRCLWAIVLDHDASEWLGYHQADGCDDSEHAANRRRFRNLVRDALDDGDYQPGDIEVFATQDEHTWVAEVLEDAADL